MKIDMSKKHKVGGFYLQKSNKSGNVVITEEKKNPFDKPVNTLALTPTKKNVINLLEKFNIKYKKYVTKARLIDLLVDTINMSGTKEQKELIKKEGITQLKMRVADAKKTKEGSFPRSKKDQKEFDLKQKLANEKSAVSNPMFKQETKPVPVIPVPRGIQGARFSKPAPRPAPKPRVKVVAPSTPTTTPASQKESPAERQMRLVLGEKSPFYPTPEDITGLPRSASLGRSSSQGRSQPKPRPRARRSGVSL